MPNRSNLSAPVRSCSIAGIGASAGGIEALQSLFRALPADTGLALVVVQHLVSGEPEQLLKLVKKWSPLTVHHARDGDPPEPNHIYIANPDDILTLESGVFCTRPAEGGYRRPGIDSIDTFLESLAKDRGAQSIAAILSGTGTDGAAGSICVKQAGGLVLVQDPVTTMHDNMPRSVIARGAADYILPVGEIAQQLALCASPDYVRPSGQVAWTGAITRTLDEIIGLIRKQAGFDLSGYKATPLLWRIQQRMDARRVRTFEDYESLLRDEAAELEALIRGIPIHVTGFFRDPEAWETLAGDAIAPLFRERGAGEPIRAWTPACASGEEAYSVAMLLSEHADRAGAQVDFQVFATDASPEIVARASHGAFSQQAIKGVPQDRQALFFYSADGVWRIRRSLREKMIFAPQDLLIDPPFTGLDLVTCRNLLIYLDRDAVRRVLFLLHSALRVGGYLFLGKGEPLSSRQQGFEPVSGHWHIYRKVGPASDFDIKFPSGPKSTPDAIAVPAVAHRAAIEQLDLPSVLIDDEFRILRVYGDTDTFLRFPAGQPTDNLLELTQRELATDLKAAATEALAEGRPVTVSGLRDEADATLALQIRLTPIQTAEQGASPRILVSFTSQRRYPALRRSEPEAWPKIGSDLPDSHEWSEAFRISNEELEASREELHALNEELKASNEQLNAANDDLNEANAQLKDKIAELEMQSRVLSAGAVMTLFLDDRLCVRWFTPAISALFPLMRGDVGRRLTDISPKFDDAAFLPDVAAVQQTDAQREAEVRGNDGKWYLRRIRPYLSRTETAAGVAITFTDITALKRAEEALRESAARSAFLVRLADALRPLSSAWDTQRVAIRLLREQLGAVRVNYLETRVPDELEIVASDHAGAAADMLGFRYGISEATPAAPVEHLLGRTGWCNDIAADPSVTPAARSTCAALGIVAWASVPIVRPGRIAGALMVHLATPHVWSPEELTFLELMAERTWTAVERARTEEELRARNEELERFNKVIVGRELRMIDLKQEVNDLRRQLGEPRRYAPESNEHVTDDAPQSKRERA
jgi:two-component system CheB/CheR fusion protein